VRTRSNRGFTLLEILVALVVLALALLALVRTAAIQTSTFGDLRERTLAGWLAQEVLTEKRLADPLPGTGRSNGQRRFAGRDWRWDMDVQSTQAPTIRRLDVRIAAAGTPGVVVAQVSGFSGTDLAR
jgi:general secretion pathway protein I